LLRLPEIGAHRFWAHLKGIDMKTYAGSCHCGAVRFEAELELSEGVHKCNCSCCTKARAWFVVAPPERVRLLAGADAQTDYQWVPQGRPAAFLHFRFCKKCGVRTFGLGGEPGQPGAFCFVNVAALDNVDPDELASAPVKYADGKHDRFDRAPADTRLL
jgi:hypothetical protein